MTLSIHTRTLGAAVARVIPETPKANSVPQGRPFNPGRVHTVFARLFLATCGHIFVSSSTSAVGRWMILGIFFGTNSRPTEVTLIT